MIYDQFHSIWLWIELLNGIFVTVFSLIGVYILYKHREDGAPLTIWALNAKKSKFQFTLLVVFTFVLIASFAIFIFGTAQANDTIREISDIIGTFTYLFVGGIMMWWVRDFVRFL